MTQLNEKIPSNKNFGYSFSLIFCLLAFYFYLINFFDLASYFSILSIIFFGITRFKPSLLNGLNKIWFSIGKLLGIIFSPIILGIIFFGIFTPLSLIMKLFKRDELKTNLKIYKSTWKTKETFKSISSSFNNQF